jgi:phage/plasmid-associated DNA primase
MTTENHLKKFINLIGEKDGGKSLCIEHHSNILGQFASPANQRLFVEQKSKSVHDSEMFNLIGRKMVFVTETKSDQRFNEDLIKKISGCDGINIRGASDKKTINVKFDTVLFLATNNVCKFEDDAFKDRLLCFEFTNRFEKDSKIPIRMKEIQHAYFTVLTEYAKKFYDNGLKIDWSQEVIDSTDKVRRNADPFIRWFSECEFSKGDDSDFVKKEWVYDSYKRYCAEEKEKAVGATSFHQLFSCKMGVQGKKMEKTIDGLKEQFQGYPNVKRE